VGQAIEERGGHLGVAEDRSPFAEAEIGGDGDAGAIVELAQKVEEQGAARGAERQVAEFVEYHEIGAREALGDLSGLAPCLLLLERVDELDGREEPDLLPVVLDGLDPERRRDMGLSRARPPDQDDVVGAVDCQSAWKRGSDSLSVQSHALTHTLLF
jgi:hypothetical protein